MATLKVEIQRLLTRRLFKGLTIFALAAFAFAGTMAYIASDDSSEAVAEAQRRRGDEVAACVAHIESGTDEASAQALRDPRAFCENEVWVDDPRFNYADMPWILGTIGMPLMMLGWLLGASAMGAEFASRSLTTTLTWEPRRLKLLGAKAGAAAVIVFVWVLILQIAFSGAMIPAAAFEGTMGGVDARWLADYAGLMARAAAVGSLAAVFGLTLATIGRNTAAAMGVGFVYLAVVEGLVRAFRPSWIDWLIGDNTTMFLIGPPDVTHINHTQIGSGLLLVAYAAALLALAGAVLRRREIA